MRFLSSLILIFLLLSFVLADCSDEQININTATATDLDKIVYVGPATASKIIDARPFESLVGLLDVYGIGETKLKAIKEEGLACIENSEEEEEEEEKTTIKEELTKKEEIQEKTNTSETFIREKIELQIINLSSKDIKNVNSIQENKKENLTKKYASFGIFSLCVLVLILLFLQKRKNGIE